VGRVARVIKTTLVRMTIAAIAIRSVTASPASPQPSSTATTGFTYACVDTRAGVLTRSSHVYAENPTMEPNTIR
jgi:hypothetical protein